jgi:two-component system response regulator YesN
MAKILIVEDNVFFRKLLKETLLTLSPYMTISEARNAEETLKKMSGSIPDLIFIDIRLSGESGLELTRKIKTEYPDVPVIILTSYDFPEYIEVSREYQANHFLSKGTVTREDILTVVKSILSKRNSGLNNQIPEEVS